MAEDTRTIWRYPVGPIADALVVVEMPVGAQIAHMDWRYGTPHLWCIVLPSAPKCARSFRWCGTGHPIPSDAVYIGTIQRPPFVWHLVEVAA